jgi:hypothetical protein
LLLKSLHFPICYRSFLQALFAEILVLGTRFPTSRGTLSDLWYFIDSWGIHGPIQRNHLLKQLDKGFVRLETLVWSEGMEDWVPLSETGLLPKEATLIDRSEKKISAEL